MAGARSPLDDGLPVGGPRGTESLLAFGPVPAGSQILRALLVLHPHDPTARIGARCEVVVEHVEPFRGGALPARFDLQPLRFAAARRSLPEGRARPIRFDVTGAARGAADRADRTLHLLLRLRDHDGERLRFASPWHSHTAIRPRLNLLTH